MEQYGRAGDGSQSDPSPEWTGSGGETGLEEPMWQLRLASGESYPQRPDEADCIYYLRTGYCGYGSRCRFNHPRDRGAVIGAARTGGEYPERVGQPVCQYYMRTGSCKFGASCKYHHPRQGGTVAPVSLNYYGYPLRPGEKECSYYVKTGQCKFGSTCKFHHPQPSAIQVPAPSPVPPASPIAVPVPPPLYSPVQLPSGPSSQPGLMIPRPSVVPGSWLQSPYGAFVVSPTIVPYPGWPSYQASGSPVVPPPTTPPNVGATQFYGVTSLPSSATAYTGPYQFSGSSVGPSGSGEKEQSFPERPGQPECQYYMKTGDCKLGPSCRYHHPPELIAPKTNVALSPAGLPLRPGAAPCIHYTQRGVCKFGPACRFDHPAGTLAYSPSASSLADMPVAPYPVGSSMATLAPSSSSSELRPEPTAGSNKESVSNKTSSSSSTSAGLVGSTSSAGGPISQSDPQPSAQSSSPLVTITSTITTTTTTTTTSSTTASHTSS